MPDGPTPLAAASPGPVALDALTLGGRGRILAVHGDLQLARRLMEMGLIPGETVEFIGRAPFGDPLTVRIRGSRLALRRSEARHVQIDIG